jgi:hypothetical protein
VSATKVEIIRDLRSYWYRSQKAPSCRSVRVHVLSAASSKIGATRLVCRAGCQPEIGSQDLRVHQTGIGGRRACTGRDCGCPHSIIVRAAARTSQRLVKPTVDSAVTENDCLAERLSRCLRHHGRSDRHGCSQNDHSRSRQKALRGSAGSKLSRHDVRHVTSSHLPNQLHFPCSISRAVRIRSLKTSPSGRYCQPTS